MEGKAKKKKAKLKKKKKAKGSSSDSEEESESRLTFKLYLLRNVFSEFEVKVIQYNLKFSCIFLYTVMVTFPRAQILIV